MAWRRGCRCSSAATWSRRSTQDLFSGYIWTRMSAGRDLADSLVCSAANSLHPEAWSFRCRRDSRSSRCSDSGQVEGRCLQGSYYSTLTPCCRRSIISVILPTIRCILEEIAQLRIASGTRIARERRRRVQPGWGLMRRSLCFLRWRIRPTR